MPLIAIQLVIGIAEILQPILAEILQILDCNTQKYTHQRTNTLTLRFLNIGKGNKQLDYIYYLIIYIL